MARVLHFWQTNSNFFLFARYSEYKENIFHHLAQNFQWLAHAFYLGTQNVQKFLETIEKSETC